MGLFPLAPTKKVPEEETASLTSKQLRVQLKNARPSLRRDSYFVSAGAAELDEFTFWVNAQQHGHGIFVCCCGHDNTLQLHDGKFPFLKVTCGKCNHILCKNCLTTAIATPLKDADLAVMEKLDLPNLRAVVDKLFQICPNCGLSRRAQMRTPDHHGERFCWVPVASHSHSEMCPCGASAKSDWLKFVIGDPTAYCRDPAKALDDLKYLWIEKGLEKNRQLEQNKAAQKPPSAKWEEPGHRRAHADKTPRQHTNSLAKSKARPFNSTHPDRVSQQEVAQSHSLKHPEQGTPKPAQPIRRQPEHLTLVQHASLKRRGAVRGSCTPRSGSIRSLRIDPPLTPRTASFSESRNVDRPGILPRAGTWATADEHRRINEPSYFASSDTFGQFTQPPVSFEPTDDSDPITPTGDGQTPQFVRKSSTMTMHAPQPERRFTSHVPVLPYKANAGDKRHKPLKHSHTIASCHGVIEDTNDSDGELTPRQASFRARIAPSKVPLEREWIDARQSMIERGGDHAFDEDRLDRVKDFLGAAMSFLD